MVEFRCEYAPSSLATPRILVADDQPDVLSCAARCEESGAVGGDFYDLLDLGTGRLGLVVADVCGKGVPAAIVNTDGLTETRDRANQELGAERLLALLRDGAGLAAETLVARLLDARRAFAAGDERDDVTVLVARGRETEAA